MSEPLRSVIKKLSFFLIIISISAVVVFLMSAAGITQYLDTKLYDLFIKNRVSSNLYSKSPLIATIDLNDASINILGEQLDTREAFSDIMNILNESNASAAFDFLFRHKKNNDNDFTKEIEWAGDTIIAALAVNKEIANKPSMPYSELNEEERNLLKRHIWHIKIIKDGKIPEAQTLLLPLPAFIETAGQIALINVEPDHDGIYRRIPLLHKWEDGYLPALSLAAGVMYWGIPPDTIELRAGEFLSLPLSEKEAIHIPIDEKGNVLVPFTETWIDQQNRIPFHKIISARYDDIIFDEVFSDLNGKIAILAEISTSQKDYGPTSFEKLYPLSGLHAEVLSGILDWSVEKTFIRSNSMQYKIIILLLILCTSFLLSIVKKEMVFHIGFFLVTLGFSLLVFFRMFYIAISPWFAIPAILLLILWTCIYINRLFYRYRQQLLLHNALSRYFPHALAQRILREKKTDLKPAYKEVSILFSDIAGFTKWSSEKNPEDVHIFLNDYLESMAEILFAHNGTVDKFMGDGILAFFGDPLEIPNHTEMCVNAAIAMQKKCRILAEKWKPLAGIELNVRIGINTGKVIVGNLGTKTRIEYTVIGAPVNLAQRMESSAPPGGILVTAAVREKLKNKFHFTEKQNVAVKGYAETIEAYVVDIILK